MRTLTKLLIAILSFPFLVTGFIFGFLVESFKAGLDLCDGVLHDLSRWLNK